MKNVKVYNKLVRDKIPEIIVKNGGEFQIQQLDELTYLEKLDEKLLEECHELTQTSDKAEEVADILEVLHAYADVHGFTMSEVEVIRRNKLEKRGAFKKRILLKSATLIDLNNE